MMDASTTKKTLIWTTISGFLYACIALILPMVTTRLIGADAGEEAGKAAGGAVADTINIGQLLITIGLFSVRTFQVSDDKGQFSFSKAFSFRLWTVTWMAAASAVWILVGGYSRDKLFLLILMLVFKMTEAFSDLFEGTFQQENRFYVAGRILTAQNFLAIAGYVATLVITKDPVVSLLVTDILYAAVVFGIHPRFLHKPLADYRPRLFTKDVRNMLLLCAPAFMNAFLLVYLDNCAKFEVEKTGGEAVLMEFTALFLCVFVINLFAGFFLKTLLKDIADRYHKKDRKGLFKLLRILIGVILALTICGLGLAELIGLPILGAFYKMDLSNYHVELGLIFLAGGLNAVNSLLLNLLIIMRRQIPTLVCTFLCAAVAFITMPIFVTKMSILMGGAVGYLVIVTVLFLLYGALVIKCIQGNRSR